MWCSLVGNCMYWGTTAVHEPLIQAVGNKSYLGMAAYPCQDSMLHHRGGCEPERGERTHRTFHIQLTRSQTCGHVEIESRIPSVYSGPKCSHSSSPPERVSSITYSNRLAASRPIARQVPLQIIKSISVIGLSGFMPRVPAKEPRQPAGKAAGRQGAGVVGDSAGERHSASVASWLCFAGLQFNRVPFMADISKTFAASRSTM